MKLIATKECYTEQDAASFVSNLILSGCRQITYVRTDNEHKISYITKLDKPKEVA